jgi:hypothetical protein
MPPLVIMAGISAVSALASAKVQSNAAKNAQKAQQAGTDKALAVQQQANQPYMDLGKSSAQRLGQMTANAQPYTQQFTGAGGSTGAQAFTPAQQGMGSPQGPSQGSLGSLGQPQGAPGMGGPPQGGMPPQGQQGPPMGAPSQGQMVQLQAPDGSVRPFPAAQADSIIQKARAQGHELRRVG